MQRQSIAVVETECDEDTSYTCMKMGKNKYKLFSFSLGLCVVGRE